MKRILGVITLTFLCTFAHANHNFKGIYAGFEGGLRTFNLNEKGDLRRNGVLFRVAPNSINSFAGGIFIGLNSPIGISNWYTGVELSAQFDTAKKKSIGTSSSKRSDGGLYKMGLRFGHLFMHKFAAYLIGGFGYDAAGVKIWHTNNKHFSFWGVGFDYNLMKKWRVRFTYNYDWYIDQKSSSIRSWMSGGQTRNYIGSSYKQSPNAHTFMLGLLYQF